MATKKNIRTKKAAPAKKPATAKNVAKKGTAKPVQHIQQVEYRTNRYLLSFTVFPRTKEGAILKDRPLPLSIYLDVHNITDGIHFDHFNEHMYGQAFAGLSHLAKCFVDVQNSILHHCSTIDTYKQKAYIEVKPYEVYQPEPVTEV